MGDFPTALAALDGVEGGWVFDRRDPGGETYRGVSRVAHPGWSGWPILDAIRASLGDPNSAETRARLQPHVESVYRGYWDGVACDHFPQMLAGALFDCAVNMGIGAAVLMLPEALTVMNRGGALYPDVAQDGNLGPRTLAAFAALPARDHAVLTTIVQALRGARYVKIALTRPEQRAFLRGWIARLTPADAGAA